MCEEVEKQFEPIVNYTVYMYVIHITIYVDKYLLATT